jgi:Na+/melibiose symporter-like transporter
MDDAAAGASTRRVPPLRLSSGQLLRLSALWFGLQFFWTSQQLIVMPERVEAYVPEAHVGMYYGWLKAAGAVIVVLTQLSVGFLSDHSWSRLGRRRPWMLAGTVSGLGAIVCFMLAPDYGWLFATYLFLELALNTVAVSFQSLLPDLVPDSQHAQAGSYMGLLDLGGNLFGFLSLMAMTLLYGKDHNAGYLHLLLPLYLLVLLVLALVNILGVDETGWQQHLRERLAGSVRALRLLPGTLVKWAGAQGNLAQAMLRDYLAIDLRKMPNFVWLAASRFVIYFSYQNFTSYVGYYVKYNLDGAGFLMSFGLSAAAADKYRGFVLPVMLLFFIFGGLAGALLATPLARRYGKKAVIGGGIGLTTLMSIPLIVAHSVWLAVAAGSVLGLGWGAFLASDWAFACALMPKQQAGSYMGLWGLTNLLPQVLAPVLAGVIRDAVYNAQSAAGSCCCATCAKRPAARRRACPLLFDLGSQVFLGRGL